MSGRNKFTPAKGRGREVDLIGSASKRWYIFYLRPKAEKAVRNELVNRGYEVYWPTYRAVRVWKNRQKKLIELPLFPNYLFVYTFLHELYAIKCLPKVVSYIASDGRPSVISEREIDGIRRMVGLEEQITVEAKFCKGQHVRIVSGPLAGYEGILTRRNGKNRFGIALKAINQTAFIDIDVSKVEKLDQKL